MVHPYAFTNPFRGAGINIFLDGFVPTENMRFRHESLSFKVSDQLDAEEVKRLHTYTYPSMTKTLEGFQLSIDVRGASEGGPFVLALAPD
jgi:ATP-binding cassette subfamily E protein 1